MITRKAVFLVSISVCISSVLLASQAVPNWPAPASWSPPRAHGATTLTDVTSPVPFIGVTPCRVADTRGNGFTGAYGPPSLAANTPRSFTITGQCGIPVGAAAVSFNFAALNVGAGGDLRVYPAGGSAPLVSTMNYNASTPNIANAAIVPLGTGGAITVLADATTIDLIIDVNGYYASTPATSTNYFSVINTGLYAIYGQTSNPDPFAAGVYGKVTTGSANGVFGQTVSTSNGTAGVFGWASSTIGKNFGVAGDTDSTTDGARGVDGLATASTGKTFGVTGGTNSTTLNASGVFGRALATSGQTYGVQGQTNSSTDFTAGVIGLANSTTGQVYGVLGGSPSAAVGAGVGGALLDTNGTATVIGLLGSAIGVAADSTGAPWGVFSQGNLGATGTKHFVEPHPSDPTKVILYSSLEGREVGTYFRGTSRIVNHQAVIEVPEDFRIVTDDDGLTVQLTPVGDLATLAVVSQDLNQIVVKASRDVPFHYLVQGVRRAFKDLQPIQIGYEFVPRSPSETFPPYLTEEARRRLIANGTYNADGTVNMETARRMGWTKAWTDRKTAAARFTVPDSEKADPASEKK